MAKSTVRIHYVQFPYVIVQKVSTQIVHTTRTPEHIRKQVVVNLWLWVKENTRE